MELPFSSSLGPGNLKVTGFLFYLDDFTPQQGFFGLSSSLVATMRYGICSVTRSNIALSKFAFGESSYLFIITRILFNKAGMIGMCTRDDLRASYMSGCSRCRRSRNPFSLMLFCLWSIFVVRRTDDFVLDMDWSLAIRRVVKLAANASTALQT